MGIKNWLSRLFGSAGYPAISDEMKPAQFGAISNLPFSYDGDGSKWLLGLSSSGSSIALNHSLIRQNARNIVYDSPQAKAIVERFADTVVDVGLRVEPIPNYKELGITPEQAEAWSEEVEARFHIWARDKRSTRNETLSFYQAQRLAEVFQQRDNDYFVRFYYSDNRELLNPLQIGFLDPNQIRGYGITNNSGFQCDKDGIERDAAGREIAYAVYVRTVEDTYKSVIVPAVDRSSGRTFMIHGFQPEYAGQGRGYSRLAHAIQEFENLTDFSAAQIKKAINQSSITMYTKPSKENAASNPMAEITRYAAGPMDPETFDDPQPTEETSGPLVGFNMIPEATVTRPGSVAVFSLQEGEDLKPFEGTAPAESYAAFVEAFAGHLAASMSIPLEIVLMKFGQSYSASRAALILFWRVAQIWREELATDFLNPVYAAWLAEEIAAGRVSAPGWSDPRLRAAWLNANWIGVPMPNIDPAKTAQADKAYIEMGSQDLDRVARNLNGSSGARNRAKLARQIAELTPVPWSKTEKDTADK